MGRYRENASERQQRAIRFIPQLQRLRRLQSVRLTVTVASEPVPSIVMPNSSGYRSRVGQLLLDTGDGQTTPLGTSHSTAIVPLQFRQSPMVMSKASPADKP
jgi:hypothetical protein